MWEIDGWTEDTDIEVIAKAYLGMLLMYIESYDQLDRVDKSIITSPEIFKRLQDWLGN